MNELGNVAFKDGIVHRVGMVAKDGVFSLDAATAPTSGITRCGYPYSYTCDDSGDTVKVVIRPEGKFSLTDGFASDEHAQRTDVAITCSNCKATLS